MHATDHLLSEKKADGTSVGFLGSVLGHVALFVALLLYSGLSQRPTLQAIPISIVSIGDGQNLHSQLSDGPEISSQPGTARPKRQPQFLLSSTQVEHAPTPLESTTAEAAASVGPGAFAEHSSNVLNDRDTHVGLESPSPASGLDQAQQAKHLWNTAATANSGGTIDFVEQQSNEAPGLTITSRTEWQANPVEDNKLTYSAPGSAVKLTVREASSAGFSRTFAHGIGLNNDETSGPFGLTSAPWGTNALARSQRVDWTLVNLKNFGITAFGYQNEVGRDFEPFGQTKKEFATAGSTTMKAGGQVRVGPLGFGFAQSSIASTDGYAGTYFTSTTTDSTVQQEASASLNLSQLVPGSLAPKLLPTLWMSAGTSRAPTSGQASETITTSFGGTWTWDMGYASLGYWNYSSGRNANLGAAWSGRGFDANLGAYRSSFGIDVGLSYGQSDEVASSWQSAGALYNSNVTVSYKPDKLPGVWVTAAVGNYDHNAITFGGSSSDSYAVTTNGEYMHLTAGLDLTGWFWAPELLEFGEATGERPSVKVFYRYSEGVFLAGSAGATRDLDSLVAMTIQRKF